MMLFRVLALVICIFIYTVSAEPPEIVALTSAANGFQPRESAAGIDPESLSLVRRWTWRSGCPVAPDRLTALTVSYWNFTGKPQIGQLIVNRDLVIDLEFIFQKLFEHGFLMEHIAPVETYNGDDAASMAANNTSAFNCRDVTGQPGKFSNHSWGRAIDINPLTNPMILHGKALPPAGIRYTDRSSAHPGSILAAGFIVQLFESRGWIWGGNWANPDYQHFEKPDASKPVARK